MLDLRAIRPTVQRMAQALVRHMPACVDRDDLVQAGMLGALYASRTWEADRGEFEVYARPRIRGAMIDELRAGDPLTRHDRRRLKQVEAAGRAAAANGRVRWAAIAQALGITEQALHDLRAIGHRHTVVTGSAGQSGMDEEDLESRTATGPIEDQPDHIVLRRQMARIAFEEIGRLQGRQRDALVLQIDHGLTQVEIGERWGLTPARVSQITSAAVERLRQAVLLRKADADALAAGLPPVDASLAKVDLPLGDLLAPDIVTGCTTRLLHGMG